MTSNHQAEIHTNKVLIEIGKKRARQRFLGYTPEHDDEHGVAHIMAEMDRRLEHHPSSLTGNVDHAREELVHQAAMLVSAIEIIDRTKEIK